MNNESKRDGYVQIKVTVKQLFESGETSEPSEKTLRARAKEGILSLIGSVGNTYYYDKMLSGIRVTAARKCKKPGIKWSDLERAIKRDKSLDRMLIKRLNNGDRRQDIISDLVNSLSAGIISER